MNRPRRSIFPAALLLICALPMGMVASRSGLAISHVPPPIHLTFTIQADDLRLEVMIWGAVFEEWTGYKAQTARDFKGAALEAAAQRIQKCLAKRLEVRIDDLAVRPLLKSLALQKGNQGTDYIPYMLLDFSYGAKARPRSMSFAWKDWEGLFHWPTDQVLVFIEDGSEELGIVHLTQKEPEHTWHAPPPKRRALPPPALQAPQRNKLHLPILSLCILAAFSAGVLFLRRRFPKKILVGLALAGLALAFVLQGSLVWSLAPPWESGSSLPGPEKAARIFESLHRNIYRAFDYKTESNIYEALKESAAPRLLDTIYNQIYESLILRNQGGAVCHVRSVKTLSSQVIYPQGRRAGFYKVRHRWRVQGSVEHYGHKHLRTNEYKALYTVGLLEGHYKIQAVVIEEQKRVGSDVGLYK